ncbi:MAG: hypothetical protein NT084_15095 [Bacteroidetes bacterium]|jgi:hypothetical protein|nr:hypothetical protein [Bacteroidota bacterium]
MLYQEFYSELGKLLYAVADFDGTITKKEKRTLYEIVRKKLVPSEKHKDEFGTDVAYYVGMEFDYCDEENSDPEIAFSSFIDFVEEHHTAFDAKLKKVCLLAPLELAKANHKTNKVKKLLIRRLKNEIDKIYPQVKTIKKVALL